VLRLVVLRPVVFFAVLRPLDVERDRLVPEVDRALVVPDVERARLVPVVERERLVPDVDRAREVVDRFAAVARPPFAPAARFCAVVPPRLEVERARLVPVVERERLVPEVDRAREVVDREDDEVDRFAAVARPPLRPAAFFCAVEPPRVEVDRERDVPELDRLRLVVERDVVRDVPVFEREPERLVPDVERERVLLVDRRGDAALARETASSVTGSSVTGSSATGSLPKRSGIKPGLLMDSGGNVCSVVIDSDGRSSCSGSGVKAASPKRPGSSSRLSSSK
jgi:hypothetical protein